MLHCVISNQKILKDMCLFLFGPLEGDIIIMSEKELVSFLPDVRDLIGLRVRESEK